MRITERFGTEDLARAAGLLRDGRLVAFPTETVYGLGANALDASAVSRIFRAKERPAWDPLIVHVCHREMAGTVARVSGEAERLMQTFWPGPLTLLLPRTEAIPDEVTSGRDLVGIRMPRHPVALELIRLAGVPVAAPSANRFGRTSPTTAAHVLLDLDGRIDGVVDGGATTVGVESTVLDVAGRVVYRPGAVSVERLTEALGVEVSLFGGSVERAPESLPSPGVGMRHYAPKARLVLVRDEATMRDAVGAAEGIVGVMLPEGWDAGLAAVVFHWGKWHDGEVLARLVFAGLRELDQRGVDVIVCPIPPMPGIGEAIRDRLDKAARPR